jgi:hypothetical protein
MAHTNLSEQDCHPRDRVHKHLDDKVVSELWERFSVGVSFEAFRDSIVTTLSRYEIRLFGSSRPPKKERRKKITKIIKSTAELLTVLECQREPNASDLIRNAEDDAMLEQLRISGLWGEDTREPIPPIDETVRLIRLLHQYGKQYLDDLETTEAVIYGETPLDQLILEVEGMLMFFNNETDGSVCYYDGVRGHYRGNIFDFVKILLDSYPPANYFSDDALGKRITRVLKKDKAV